MTANETSIDFINIALLFFSHTAVSFIAAQISARYLVVRFPKHRDMAFMFMFIYNLSMPVIGYISSIWISYYLRTISYEKKLEETSFLDLELFENNFIKVERQFGEGSIQDMMLNEFVPTEKKIKALVSMSDNISQNNIQIIKNTLSSSDDEVRLYSFAIIDKIERGINGKIYKSLDAFKKTDNEKERAKLAKDLAFLYWEMIYYELSEDSLRDYLLQEVLSYIEIAKEHYNNDPKLHILLGRVYMLKKEYIKASSQFTLANELSPEDLAFIMPYLAEINFITGHYNTVKTIIKNADGLDLNSTMFPIVEQWKVS